MAPTATEEGPPLEALRSRCGMLPQLVYRLGADGSGGNLPGNAFPVRVQAADGTRFVIWARFAQRHLASFALTGDAIRRVCEVTTSGVRGGPAAVFTAVHRGTATVRTRTDDCGPCAALGFAAEVSVPH